VIVWKLNEVHLLIAKACEAGRSGGVKHDAEKLTREREEAWVGDAVLALHVREKILKEDGKLDGEKFIRFTSNEFLSAKGNPTSVEAEIGRIYYSDGLDVARQWIEDELLPLFLMKEKSREKLLRTQGGRKKKR